MESCLDSLPSCNFADVEFWYTHLSQCSSVDGRGRSEMVSCLVYRAVSFELLSEDLVEALVVLARYIIAVEVPDSKEAPFRLAQAGGAAWLPLSPVQPIVSMQVLGSRADRMARFRKCSRAGA